MTPKKARAILENEKSSSIEEITEAHEIIRRKSIKTKSTDPRNSLLAYKRWKQHNKVITDLKNEIRKYWVNNTPKS